MGRITGFRNSTTGLDIGQNLVEKSYLIDRYPELADTFKQAGLWNWGYNGYGNLGDGTVGTSGGGFTDNSKSSPIQTIAGGTNWKQVSEGYFNIGGIKTDGTLWIWGYSTSGQLGHNVAPPATDWAGVSSPIQTVAGGTNWKQLSVGSSISAIKTDGTLWMWGVNLYGSVGDNTITNRSSPVQTVSGGTNWKEVSSGNSNVVAIKTDGTLWTWGYNEQGQLGDGTDVNKSSPVQTVAGGTNWKQVSTGGSSVGAIKTDGTLWMWGNNNAGQSGDNTIVNKSSPVQTVAGGSNWKQVSSRNFCGAIKTDGALWVWGLNSNGQLGDGTIVNKSSPVQTVAGGTNWKQVSSSGSNAAAIKTDGTLWTWGYNGDGQLGTNNRTDRSSPVQTVTGGTNWKQVSATGSLTMAAIRDDSADIFGNPV
jgi:YD repeat-containing protein